MTVPRRNPWPALWLLVLGLLVVPPDTAWADRAAALRLVAQAQEALEARRLAEAHDLLQQALRADPTSPEPHATLGYLAELEGLTDEAVTGYGQALRLRPTYTYAAERLRAVLHSGPFPRSLSLDLLPLLPIAMTADHVRASLGPPPAPREVSLSLAYTVGLLYPEQMRAGGPAPSFPLPIAGVISGETFRCNRVRYGYLAAPDSDQLHRVVELYYPSPTLSREGADYDALATRLTHWLVRLLGYYRLHLSLEPPTQPIRAYLCEAGPLAAEAFQGSIYFYRVAEPRSALEWMREGAHEMGHVLLPRIGRFTAPEPWGNGHAGERLALQWLAAEAALVAGTPWPAPAAQRRLNHLWEGEEIALAEYLAQRVWPLLDAWCQAGPQSALLDGDDEETLSYLLGFFSWVQAAHGEDLLRAGLFTASGVNPPEYVAAYQAAVERRLRAGTLPLFAGALSLPASRLTATPAEGALRRREVSLAAGDRLVLPLYLPAGAWELRAYPTPLPETVAVSLNAVRLSFSDEGVVSAVTDRPGWHTLQLVAGDDLPPTPLQYLLLKALPLI